MSMSVWFRSIVIASLAWATPVTARALEPLSRYLDAGRRSSAGLALGFINPSPEG